MNHCKTTHRFGIELLILGLVTAAVGGCGDDTGGGSGGGAGTGGSAQSSAVTGSGGGTGELDIARCDPGAGPFSVEIEHPYFPMPVGKLLVFSGEEDGALVDLEIEVLDEVEVVAGVTTRVVEERATEDGELHEVARNFFAQAPDGSICYFGETTDFYEDGEIVDHEGAWRAGEDGARPGIYLPADPAVGMSYDQEAAPGISEDHAEIVAIGVPFTVPGGTFDDTLDTEETSPLDPGVSESKRYARDVGLIVSGPLLLQ